MSFSRIATFILLYSLISRGSVYRMRLLFLVLDLKYVSIFSVGSLLVIVLVVASILLCSSTA
jgi:hypothetical protein